jgi:DNA/RNA endonuclease YhcR with UshA esterase domain
VTLKGEIVSVRIFKEEKGRTLEINDGTGSIDVVIWKELYESILGKESLVQGTSIQVSGQVASYKGKFEIKTKKPLDIQILKMEAIPISSLTEASIGQRVTLKGEIVSVRIFKEEKGRTLEINDGTGSINVVIWKELYESIPEKERLIQGIRIEASGQIGSYAGEMEIKPKDLSDIQILKIEEEVVVPEVIEEKPPVPEVVPEEVPVEEEVPPVPEVVPEKVAPPKVEEKVPKPEIQEIVHIVKKGDTLAKIAERYLGDAKLYKKLARENEIEDPNRISPGQEIKIRVIWKP